MGISCLMQFRFKNKCYGTKKELLSVGILNRHEWKVYPGKKGNRVTGMVWGSGRGDIVDQLENAPFYFLLFFMSPGGGSQSPDWKQANRLNFSSLHVPFSESIVVCRDFFKSLPLLPILLTIIGSLMRMEGTTPGVLQTDLNLECLCLRS